MRISNMMICDFAQVREGLLTVCSGGITRVSVPVLPAGLGVMVASLLEFGPDDVGPIHEITWRLSHVDGAETVANGTGAIQVTEAPSLEPGELMQVPLVIDLRPIAVLASGQFDFKLRLDGAEDLEIRSLWVSPRLRQD